MKIKKNCVHIFLNLWIRYLKEACLTEAKLFFKKEIEMNWRTFENIAILLKSNRSRLKTN